MGVRSSARRSGPLRPSTATRSTGSRRRDRRAGAHRASGARELPLAEATSASLGRADRRGIRPPRRPGATIPDHVRRTDHPAARSPASASSTCSTVLAGPYCTMLLADLGADVVKVEPPEGDATRGWGPPWVGDEAAGTRTAAYFLAVNRNKRSIRLDLRTGRRPRGPPPAPRRRRRPRRELPVGRLRAAGLRRRRARASSTRRSSTSRSAATGRTGPTPTEPGYDFVIQAAGGLMSITGDAGRRRRPADQGRRRDQRRRDRAVRGDRRPGGARWREARAAGPAASASTSRSSASTLAILVNQAQNAFVDRDARRAGAATPTRTSSRTRRSPPPTARSPSRSAASASGRGCARRSGCPSSPTDPRFATNGDRVDRAASCGRSSPPGFAQRGHGDLARRRSRRPAIPCGADQRRRSPRSRRREARGARRWRVELRAPGVRAPSARSASRIELSGDAGLDPDAAAARSASTRDRESASAERRRLTGSASRSRCSSQPSASRSS